MSVCTSAIRPGHRERRDADDRDEVGDVGREPVERPHARDQVDAGRDHRGGVDQRGDRGRALHRVRQPGVQRQLRRLGDRRRRAAAARSSWRSRSPTAISLGASANAVGVVDRVQVVPDHEDAERHPDVADRVHDERLLGRRDRGRALPPEADQQVRREADEAPAGEQEDEVAGQHEQQHREDEEVEVGEEPLLLGVAVHVADRVGVDQEADAGDDEQHHGRERVDEDARVDLEVCRPRASASRSRRSRAASRRAPSRSMNASSESTKPGEDRERCRPGRPCAARRSARRRC